VAEPAGASESAEQLPVFWLWPECLPAWNAWAGVQTQWRHTGMDASATGLDYAGVTAWLQAHRYGHGRRRNLRETPDHIGAMERETLTAWRETQAKKAPPKNG